MDWMPQAIRDGIIVILIISGPLVLAAALIGLIVGVLQAATQVQEQTIGSALKIIGVFAVIIFAGFWMYQYLNQYTARTLNSAFSFVSMQGQKAVPTGEFSGAEFDEGFNKQAEPINQPLQVIAPEKLEEKLPGGDIPLGAPLLGVPEVPKPPSVSKIVAPKVPEPPQLMVEKPEIPLSPYQEPKIISPLSQEEKKETVTPKEEPEPAVTDQSTPAPVKEENIENNQLNLVPGNPVNSNAQITIDPLLKKDNFSENSNQQNSVIAPSWLD